MALALRLGKTLDEIRAMPAEDYLLFRAYDRLSPISDARAEFMQAQTAAAVFQAQGVKLSASDLLPDWSGTRRQREAEEQHRAGQQALLDHLLALAEPAPHHPTQ